MTYGNHFKTEAQLKAEFRRNTILLAVTIVIAIAIISLVESM